MTTIWTTISAVFYVLSPFLALRDNWGFYLCSCMLCHVHIRRTSHMRSVPWLSLARYMWSKSKFSEFSVFFLLLPCCFVSLSRRKFSGNFYLVLRNSRISTPLGIDCTHVCMVKHAVCSKYFSKLKCPSLEICGTELALGLYLCGGK